MEKNRDYMNCVERKIVMPRLRSDMESGIVCAWLVKEGDHVSIGDPLFEIETDKVVTQVESTEAGYVERLVAEEGDLIEVDATVAVIAIDED